MLYFPMHNFIQQLDLTASKKSAPHKVMPVRDTEIKDDKICL